MTWKRIGFAVFVAASIFPSDDCRSNEPSIEEITLPPLRIQGQPARAHTQGMELHAGSYYVTARREDIRPKQALLLRIDSAGKAWHVWNVTPVDAQDPITTTLDHPGGMQSDGKRLWLPLGESRRNGRSIIR